MHAFLAWFDITFACTHKQVQFSTGPQAQYTHWKQTVFYTPGEPMRVSEGDYIEGSLACAPNARNPRDLDIAIAYKTDSGTVPETVFNYKMCVPFRFYRVFRRLFVFSFLFSS